MSEIAGSLIECAEKYREAVAQRDALAARLAEVEAENDWLRKALEKERGPWIEEVKSQMVPALRAAEAESARLRARLAEVEAENKRLREQPDWEQAPGAYRIGVWVEYGLKKLWKGLLRGG